MIPAPFNDRDTDDLVEAIAQRVVELLHDQPTQSTRLVSATELARILGISRGTIYARADELGAIRLGNTGDGRRPRLRFDPDKARAALTTSPTQVDEPPRTPARRHHPRQPEAPATADRKARGMTTDLLIEYDKHRGQGHRHWPACLALARRFAIDKATINRVIRRAQQTDSQLRGEGEKVPTPPPGHPAVAVSLPEAENSVSRRPTTREQGEQDVAGLLLRMLEPIRGGA